MNGKTYTKINMAGLLEELEKWRDDAYADTCISMIDTFEDLLLYYAEEEN